tara:strand:- start:506 stop:688 length:183 start_codon:yes stop_codon:yes gene_type:complete
MVEDKLDPLEEEMETEEMDNPVAVLEVDNPVAESDTQYHRDNLEAGFAESDHHPPMPPRE